MPGVEGMLIASRPPLDKSEQHIPESQVEVETMIPTVRTSSACTRIKVAASR
jgi:hypothetical protein